MWNKIRKLIYDIFVAKKKGGWIPDEADSRDFRYEEYFEDEIFGAVLPDIFTRSVDELPRQPRQYQTLACVSCAFTFVNNYNSKISSFNDVFLAWRMPYSLVKHYSGGTNFRDNANALKRYGQCVNAFLPEELYYLGEYFIRDKKHITDEAYELAKNYKIGGYFYINKNNKAAMKSAILNAPIIIGVWTSRVMWKEDRIIQWDGRSTYGHAMCIVGWDDTKRAWQLADWYGPKFKWLSYDYPLMSVVAVRDIPDNYLDKNMRIVKTFDDAKIWAVTPKGKRFHILSMEQFKAGERQGFWDMGQLKIIEKKELEAFEIEKNPPTFII